MRSKYLLFALFFTLAASLSTTVQAQFQGQIEMTLYNYENNSPTPEANPLNMYVTNDRIKFAGEDRFVFEQGISAEGFLIRNDMKDFIVMTGNNQALQVTKAEIEDLLDMFMGWGGDSRTNNDELTQGSTVYRYTDRTRVINGMETTEMIIEGDENGGHLAVWFTPNIDINWGILAEPWKNLPKDLDEGNRLSQDIVFKGKNFPMMIEAVDKNGDRKKIMEVTQLNESSIAKAMVQIPSNVTLIGAKEYIFRMMMNQ